MKPNNKDFDCVAFKDRAQLEIYEETKDLSRSDLKEYFRKRVEAGPFAEFWKELSARQR
ncbi:MAG: hypothetical protein ABIH23_21060 [bacterium]